MHLVSHRFFEATASICLQATSQTWRGQTLNSEEGLALLRRWNDMTSGLQRAENDVMF